MREKDISSRRGIGREKSTSSKAKSAANSEFLHTPPLLIEPIN